MGEILQYDIRHDKEEKDTDFIRTQLETHLKERFNVVLSTVEYEIADGHLVRPGTTEPFINSIKRGRDLLRKLSTTSEDFEREDAEVIGFEEHIDPVLGDSRTPVGTKVLNVSLPSGKYEHRFHDIATLKMKEGKRYVEYSRYSSGLLDADYAQILPGMDPNSPPTPAEFLKKPYVINDTQITADQIHKMLHKEHEYMEPGVFKDVIWNSVQPFVEAYLQKRDAGTFNAILNFADEVWENKQRKDKGEMYKDYTKYMPTNSEMQYYGRKAVKQVNTACPGKSGAGGNDSPYSVVDFAGEINYQFDQPGPCKKCSDFISCGPCGICKSCDLKIRQEDSLRIAA